MDMSDASSIYQGTVVNRCFTQSTFYQNTCTQQSCSISAFQKLENAAIYFTKAFSTKKILKCPCRLIHI